MKKILLTCCLSAHLLSASQTQTQIQSRELSTKDMKTQNVEVARLAAQEISKSLPQKIDKFTELISCHAQKSSLVYTFEIQTQKSDELIKKEDNSRMKKAVTTGTCLKSKRFLDANISINYVYKSAKTKTKLFEFDITKESCEKI